ncbi:DNA-binding transcriptional regulator CueR [Corynebacterium glaucum]|uniref:DNA-binding transcriptional regulator CueR n=1 Tax=Corynebacterium glaucum TaxID=187491 RepID=A0A1Q2HWP2_9CORY|nr:MerR family transcriptional regulator [Corynebacterium glaucum]AQQ15277.1 DNA-binding transcriptional regulator CueR [Corynebacterium glaucum]
MRISDVARAAGCSVRAIRHLHETGAVPEPARTSGNYRDYSASDLVAVLRARALIDAGVAVADTHSPDAVERSISLIDARLALLSQQRARLIALRESPVGMPADVRERLLEVLGDSAYARSEVDAFDLMAVAGVATPATWETLRANLSDDGCVVASRELADIWEELGRMRERDGRVGGAVDKLKALYPQTVMRGVAATLSPGDLPLEFGDLEVQGAQGVAVRALAGEFDA